MCHLLSHSLKAGLLILWYHLDGKALWTGTVCVLCLYSASHYGVLSMTGPLGTITMGRAEPVHFMAEIQLLTLNALYCRAAMRKDKGQRILRR